MEYLEGQTLAERLATRGALPLAQALEYAIHIADALAKAHRQGIVHRDLKPGNVMLTKEGAKLLDFGLARLTQASGATGASTTISATGTIVGTVPYMAPEQVQGQATDARTDLFAFGAVLYEMLTGKRAFAGESHASVIAAILERDPPPVSSLQPLTPPPLERLVTRCLAKDPDERWQSAHDLAQELRWIEPVAGSPSTPTVRRPRWRIAAAVVVLSACATLAGLVLERFLRPAMTASHMTISLSDAGLTLTGGGAAISPDGRTLVFAARSGDENPCLYLRRFDDPEPRPLKGTEGGTNPFFSPKGDWVAFVANNKLRKVHLDTGNGEPICNVTYQGVSRGNWGRDGRIVISQWPGGLWSVSDEGGTPEPVAGANDTAFYLWPHLLPGGKTLLFTIWRAGHTSVMALSLATRVVRPVQVIESGSRARYLPSGHLVYEWQGHLHAVPFDPEGLKMLGPSRILIEHAVARSYFGAFPDYDVSATGTLVCLPATAWLNTLVWKDRNGNATPLKLKASYYAFPALSPDGRQIAVTDSQWPVVNVWVGSIGGGPLTQITSGNSDMFGLFTPDAEWLAFTSKQNGWANIFRTRADGSGQAERLTDASHHQKPTAWSRANVLLFNDQDPQTGSRDISQLEVDPRPGVSRPFAKTSFNELEAVFAPDGRWVAYQSDETGQWEVYVQAYPGPGARRQVSTDGGMGPAWNPRGGELFY
jgi:Tol biopolymer transport system component